MKAELHLEKDAALIFFKARNVTYALCATVNEEFKKLQRGGYFKTYH